MEQNRRGPLTDEDVERIANAIIAKERGIFHLDEEYHYNAHKRLDKLLDAYENATNIFARTFLALVIVGSIVLAGVTAFKGWK